MSVYEMLQELETGLSLLQPAEADFVMGLRLLLDMGEPVAPTELAKIKPLYDAYVQRQYAG